MYFTFLTCPIEIEEIFPYPEFPVMHPCTHEGIQGYMVFRTYELYEAFREAIADGDEENFISENLK